MIPERHNSDVGRWIRIEDARVTQEVDGWAYQVCKCVSPLICEHMPETHRRAYLLTHSLYYTDENDLWDWLSEASSHDYEAYAYVIVHHFKDGTGSLCNGELEYDCRDGQVICQAIGNSAPYAHKDLRWLRAGNSKQCRYGVLAVDHVQSLGDTHLYRVYRGISVDTVSLPPGEPRWMDLARRARAKFSTPNFGGASYISEVRSWILRQGLELSDAEVDDVITFVLEQVPGFAASLDPLLKRLCYKRWWFLPSPVENVQRALSFVAPSRWYDVIWWVVVILFLVMFVSLVAEKFDFPAVESISVLKPMRDDAEIHVGYNATRLQETHCFGIGFRGCTLRCFNTSSIDNKEICVRNRILMEVPVPIHGRWTSAFEILRKRLPPDDIVPYPFDAWVERFPGGRRRELERAEAEHVGPEHWDYVRKVFIKRELHWELDDPYGRSNQSERDPRPISSIGNKINVHLGPWMYAFSKWLTRRCGVHKRLTYASGLTGEAVGEWFRYWRQELSPCIGVENDFSRFDGTIQTPALLEEIAYYESCGVEGFARDALHAQLYTKAYMMCKRDDEALTYAVPGTRKSGDPNTSCGNTLLNMAFHVYLFKVLGIPDDAWALIALGDDCLALVKKQYQSYVSITRIRAIANDFGLLAKPQLRIRLADAEFCSKLFWPVEDGVILGPKVGRLVSKIGWSVDCHPKVLQHYRGVILGLQTSMTFMPGLREYWLKVMNITMGVKAKPIEKYLTPARNHRMCLGTLAMFEEHYGISPWVFEREMRDALNYVVRIPCYIEVPSLDVLLDTDL
jgi:hypothetical protein